MAHNFGLLTQTLKKIHDFGLDILFLKGIIFREYKFLTILNKIIPETLHLKNNISFFVRKVKYPQIYFLFLTNIIF